MREVAIIGVGAHATGQFTEKPLKDLGYTAIWGALEDAGVKPRISMRPMSATRSAGC